MKERTIKVMLSLALILVCGTFSISIASLYLTLNKTNDVNLTNMVKEAFSKTVEIKVSNDNSNFGYAAGLIYKDQIITNKHVISDGTKNYDNIYYRESTELEFQKTSIISISPNSDLATLTINSFSKQFELFQFPINIGSDCYTIGNPNGYGLGLTSGFVSALNRYNDNGLDMDTIRTDMTINHGNSGGPLFNRNGLLLGIMSFRLKDGSNESLGGLSFAVNVSEIIAFLK